MKDMEINEKIRYFRKQRGLSQELLAERIGINVNTIRKYEIGIRKPKVEQLKKIADGLEISVIEFLDIEIENEADLIAMLKKISPFFKWDGLLHDFSTICREVERSQIPMKIYLPHLLVPP